MHFLALELGEVDNLVRPSEIRRQGSPVELYRWKLFALSHVHFLVGKGLKKFKALENVAQGVGQSVETLRSWEKACWEKAYGHDDDFMMALRAAELAGELEKELDSRSINELVDEYGAEYFRHSSDVEYAKLTLRELRATPLDDVRVGLRTARSAKSGI
jgi:hypothetical protein